MKRLVLALFIFVIGVSCASVCRKVPNAPADLSAPQDLLPGTYVITFEASGGSKRGHRAEGQLTLVPVEENIRRDGHPYYGWLTADLNAVGAPLCPADPPVPSSADPLNPGVLVSKDGDGRYFLVVANGGNKYTPGSLLEDGCGIVLYVDQATFSGFRGRWGAGGIVYDGCGYFEAKRTQ